MRKLITSAILGFALNFNCHGENQSLNIDKIIAADLKDRQLEMPQTISDQRFKRRLYLDVAGRIPQPSELDQETTREELINTLLDSEGYVQNMYNFWADMLRVKRNLTNNVLGDNYSLWIQDQIRENTPHDQFVKLLLTSSGSIWDNPAVGYFLRDEGMLLDNVSNTFQTFAGTDISCAQCHDDPFQDWTQLDYYEFTAFFAPLETRAQGGIRQEFQRIRKEAAELDKGKRTGIINRVGTLFRTGYQHEVYDNESKKLKLPHDYKYKDAEPNQVIEANTVVGKRVREGRSREKLRSDFADWLTSKDHPTFTANIVNRLWDRAFGFPLIDNINNISEFDELKDSKNDELLDYLCQVMKEINYDTKQFNKILFNTRFYQSEPDTENNFRGPKLRRMTANQFWDSLMSIHLKDLDLWKPKSGAEKYKNLFVDIGDLDATEAMQTLREYNQIRSSYYSGAPKVGGYMAIRSSYIAENSNNYNLLNEFGRSDRELVHNGDREGSITQVLSLMNGGIAEALANKNSFLMQQLEGKNKTDSINYIFKSFLGRAASPTEMSAVKDSNYSDIIWALLNSHEMRIVS